MKRTCLSVLLLVAGLFLITGALAMSHKGHPKPEGLAVIDYITKTNDYSQWALWPGKGKLYKGQHPHGVLLTTYVSADALQALEGKVGVLPAGAMVVKENYTADKKLDAITVMYKSKGYDAAAGDWFWLKYGTDGKIMAEGKVKGCIGCHASVKGNDWLFTGPLK